MKEVLKSGKDSKSFAGMPQDVKMVEFPKCNYYNGNMDDTITGIDDINDRSVGKLKKNISNQK